MARIPQITRTIETTKASVLCLDLETAEPFNVEIKLPRTFKDEKSLMKKVHEAIDTDKVKAVHVVSHETFKTRYGMSEQAFIDNAEILPPLKED